MRWIHQFGQSEFDSMSDLSKGARSWLGAVVQAPSVVADSTADDGTRNGCSVGSANGIETVFIPAIRGTLCIHRKSVARWNTRSAPRAGRFQPAWAWRNHRQRWANRRRHTPKGADNQQLV
jgi:hypothetical protein